MQFGIRYYDPGKTHTKQDLINSHYTFFRHQLSILTYLNKVVPKSIEGIEKSRRDQISKYIQALDEEDRNEFDNFLQYMNPEQLKRRRRTLMTRKPLIAQILLRMFDYRNFNLLMFIKEMSLVYLITSFEGFLAHILEDVFSWDPRCLRRKQKTIDYETILRYKKFEDLKDYIIQEEIKSILRGSIDQINHSLKDYFKLDLSSNDNWKVFKECFYRRNLVVHNNLYPDEDYKTKTRYKGKRKRLSITRRYLTNSLKVFEIYAKIIFEYIVKKFLTKSKSGISN
jgi:hypothetical protein